MQLLPAASRHATALFWGTASLRAKEWVGKATLMSHAWMLQEVVIFGGVSPDADFNDTAVWRPGLSRIEDNEETDIMEEQ